MPARALVTGASGFIGSAFVRRLKREGAFVRALVRSARDSTSSGADDVVAVDLTAPLDERALAGIDVIYHLAAKTHDTHEAAGAEADYTRINVDATRALVEAAVRQRIPRFVYVSSVKAMDEGGPGMRDESRPPAPETAYGRTKLAAERAVFEVASRGGVAPVCVRFPMVYGPGQRGNLANMIRAVDRGRFPPPPETGNRRSMLHVENAVDGLLLAGRHAAAPGQTYLVTDANPYSTRELYDWIRAALGRRAIRWSVPRLGIPCARAWPATPHARSSAAASGSIPTRFRSCSIGLVHRRRRSSRELGYRPAHDLRAALPELVADYRSRQGRPPVTC